jgi:putative ABC transport system permease protein
VHHALVRLSRRIVGVAARLVPSERRERFRREWDAEIAHHARAHPGESQALEILRRAVGSLPHALSVLKQEWRSDMLAQDFRYAVRTLLGRPLFLIAATLTLAIGIGANAALFSVVDAVLLRPLPYPEAERIVSVFETQADLGGTRDGPAPGNVLDWRRESKTLSAVAAWWVESTTLLGDDYGDTEEIPSARVTADFFPVLGVEALIGRTFSPEEVVGEPTVAVLSYELWQRRFGGDEAVIGADIRFKSASWRVIGVMPRGLRTPGTLEGEVQLFKPWDLEHAYGSMPDRARDHRFLRVAARLAPGVSIDDARAELDVIAAGIAAANPKTNLGWGVMLVPLLDALVADTQLALMVLLGAVGLVLLLACANVTSLLLVRASSRNREMAVRTALGASRFRLVRQLLLEAFLLSAVGGAVGLALARSSIDVMLWFAPAGVPRLDEVALDARVVSFAIIASIVAGILAGVTPAFHGSTAAPSLTLTSAGGNVSIDRRRQRLSSIIVGFEIAAAVILLVGSGLFLRSFSRVLAVDLGFDADKLLVVRMRLDGATYGGGGAHPYYTRFLDEIRSLPGVAAAGGTTGLPMDELDIDFERPFWREGGPRPDGGGLGVQIRMATVGYFETMRIPLLEGREVDIRDDRTKPRVLIVNETMARHTWPGRSPIGQRLLIDYQSYEAVYEVVGVVGDTRFYGHKRAVRRAVYIPHGQNPYLPLNIVVRAEGDPAALAPAIRRSALELDPAQPVHSIRTMEDLMSGYLDQDRFAAFLMSAFAGMALLLATIGIYGVVAFSVSQRQRELGLRLALGAESTDIARLVLGEGVGIAALGIVVGLGGAVIASRYLESLLFGVSATDPATLVAASSVSMATVLAACYLPARRASQVDPTQTLRYE